MTVVVPDNAGNFAWQKVQAGEKITLSPNPV
jgi:hypothetical protein